MLKSIRVRMAITYLLLIVVVMVVTGFVLVNMLEQHYLSSEEETLERTGMLVSEFVTTYLQEEVDPVLLSAVAENFSQQIDARVVIVGSQQRVIGDSVRIGGLLGSDLEREEVDRALEGEVGSSVNYSHQSEQWVMHVAVPIEAVDSPEGAVLLSYSLAPVYENLATIQRLLFLSTLLAMILAGLLAVIFSHHLTGPIKKLTEAAQQMAQGKLEQNILVSSRDEIGRLAQQFNIMAARINEMNQKLTRFVADVSHELRTPLASINLCVQSLQDYDMEEEEKEEFLQYISQETQRMIYLVEDLLELTRGQEGSHKWEIVSLYTIFDEVLECTRPRAERKGLTLFTSIQENIPRLYASGEALKRVLLNLLDNAIKFTSPGGWIKLKAEYWEEEDEVYLSVEDTGCGIPEESLPHIFDRFYRVDKARSRYLGGTGLGLSICREIIEFYGGKLSVQSSEDEGSTFYVTIPVIPPPEDKENDES